MVDCGGGDGGGEGWRKHSKGCMGITTSRHGCGQHARRLFFCICFPFPFLHGLGTLLDRRSSGDSGHVAGTPSFRPRDPSHRRGRANKGGKTPRAALPHQPPRSAAAARTSPLSPRARCPPPSPRRGARVTTPSLGPCLSPPGHPRTAAPSPSGHGVPRHPHPTRWPGMVAPPQRALPPPPPPLRRHTPAAGAAAGPPQTHLRAGVAARGRHHQSGRP